MINITDISLTDNHISPGTIISYYIKNIYFRLVSHLRITSYKLAEQLLSKYISFEFVKYVKNSDIRVKCQQKLLEIT